MEPIEYLNADSIWCVTVPEFMTYTGSAKQLQKPLSFNHFPFLCFSFSVGTSTCGPTAGCLVQTCLLATEAGKPSTPRRRKPVRACFAAARLPSARSAMVRSTSNTTAPLCLPRFVGFSVSRGVLSRNILGMTERRLSKPDLVPRLLQVNSDKIYWQKNKDGTFSQFCSEKNTVGLSISTKAVGSDEREDITHLYKHPEGKTKKL